MAKSLAEELDGVSLRSNGTFGDILASVRARLGVDVVAAYRPVREGGAWKAAIMGIASEDDAAALQRAVKRLVRAAPRNWGGTYDPRAPLPALRNVVTKPLQADGVDAERAQALIEALGGDEESDVARVLLCDGPMLLAVLFVVSRKRIATAMTKELRTLVPGLVRRLRMSRALESRALGEGAVCAALAAVESPAFLVGEGGAVEHANDAGMAALTDGGADLEKRIALAASGQRTKDANVSHLEGSKARGRSVVVLRGPTPTKRDKVGRFAREHALTPRQVEVLRELARGSSNRDIASALECAEVTVEVHVSALLRKAEVRSRSALLAKLWAGA